MERDPRVLLWDACDAAEAIASFIAGRTMEAYRADRMLRSAVERQCEILGEALNRLARDAPDLVARIPGHRQAIAFRHRLAHGYATLDDGIVWRVAAEEVPRLATVLAGLLRELDGA